MRIKRLFIPAFVVFVLSLAFLTAQQSTLRPGSGGGGSATNAVTKINGSQSNFQWIDVQLSTGSNNPGMTVASGANGNTNTIHLPTANATNSGILSSNDWNTFSAAVTAVSNGAALYVDQVNGSDTTGRRGRMDKPFLHITNAAVAASPGDTVFVFPGTYNERHLLRRGVNFHFYPGTTVTNYAASSTLWAIFDDRPLGGATTNIITGSGKFLGGGDPINSTNFLAGVLGVTNPLTRITFDCDRMASSYDGGNASQGFGAVVTKGGTVFLRANVITSHNYPESVNGVNGGSGANGIVWLSGDMYAEVKDIRTDGYAAWSTGTSTNQFWLSCDRMSGYANAAFYNDANNSTGKVWIVAKEILADGGLGGAAVLGSYGSTKVYIDALKISSEGQAVDVINTSTSDGVQMWIRAQKIQGSQRWASLSKGQTWIDASQYEDNGGMIEGFKITGGTNYITGQTAKIAGRGYYHGGGVSLVSRLLIDTSSSANVTNFPVLVNSSGLTLQNVALVSPSTASNGLGAFSAQTVTIAGTVYSDQTNNANVVLSGGAMLSPSFDNMGSATLFISKASSTTSGVQIRDSGGSLISMFLAPQVIHSINGALTLRAGGTSYGSGGNSWLVDNVSGALIPGRLNGLDQDIGSVNTNVGHIYSLFYNVGSNGFATIQAGSFEPTFLGFDGNVGSLYLCTNGCTGVPLFIKTNVAAAGWWQVTDTTGGGGGTLADGDKGDITVSGGGANWTIDNNTVTYAKLQDVTATQRVIGRNTAGSGDPEEVTFSQFLDWVGSAAQGDILYRGASTWSRLAAGTSGQFLQTQGAGSNPQWASTAAGPTAPDMGVAFVTNSSLAVHSAFRYDGTNKVALLTVAGNTAPGVKISDSGSTFDLYVHPRGISSSNGALNFQAGGSTNAFSLVSDTGGSPGNVLPATVGRQGLGSASFPWRDMNVLTLNASNFVLTGALGYSTQPLTTSGTNLLADASITTWFSQLIASSGPTNVVFTNVPLGRTTIELWVTNGTTVTLVAPGGSTVPSSWYYDGSQTAINSNGYSRVEITRTSIGTNVNIITPGLFIAGGTGITLQTNFATSTVSINGANGGAFNTSQFDGTSGTITNVKKFANFTNILNWESIQLSGYQSNSTFAIANVGHLNGTNQHWLVTVTSATNLILTNFSENVVYTLELTNSGANAVTFYPIAAASWVYHSQNTPIVPTNATSKFTFVKRGQWTNAYDDLPYLTLAASGSVTLTTNAATQTLTIGASGGSASTNNPMMANGNELLTNQLLIIEEQFSGSTAFTNLDLSSSMVAIMTNGLTLNVTNVFTNALSSGYVSTKSLTLKGNTTTASDYNWTPTACCGYQVFRNYPTNLDGSFTLHSNQVYEVAVKSYLSPGGTTNIAISLATTSPRPIKGSAITGSMGWGTTNVLGVGTFFFNNTAVANPTSNGTPATVNTVLVPANSMTNSGDAVVVKWWGTMPAAQANSNELVMVVNNGGPNLTALDTGMQTASNTTYAAQLMLTRTGVSSVHGNAHLEWGPGGGVPFAFTNTDFELTTATNGLDLNIVLQSTSRRQGSMTNTATRGYYEYGYR